jgi:hypothetical protein
MMDRVEQGWVGIDAGKGNHHVVLIDANGCPLLSRRVVNDELELAALIDVIRDRVTELTWAIDLADGAAALMIALLLHRDQPVFHIPGIAVNRASAGYRGEGKTDAKDAAIIADQARMRRDLRQLQLLDDDIVRLRLLTAYRADLAADRTRGINRLRGLLCRNPPVGPGSAGSLVGEAPSPRRCPARCSRRRGGRPANSGDIGAKQPPPPSLRDSPRPYSSSTDNSPSSTGRRGHLPHPGRGRHHHQLDRDR